MFYVRAVDPADLPAVAAIAPHLDSVNMPNDPERLARNIDLSVRSFSGAIDPARRELMFVLADRPDDGGAERVIGASMIFAQHGNRQAPHVFFDVLEEERYSETLDRHFRHTVLRIGYNYRGMTEIGGLVLDPAYRGHPQRLGKLLAYVRFLYIALHRDVFCREVLSELMPPLEADGTSLLWEALGRHFTGLTYQEADRLSRENKEFIRALFPQDPIYVSLLPSAAQALVGKVGAATKPVERMLRRVGFSYAQRIDPFDGGPHFHAPTDDITLVKAARRRRVTDVAAAGASGVDALIAAETPAAPYFRAVHARVLLLGEEIALPAAAAAALHVETGQSVGVVPLPVEEGA